MKINEGLAWDDVLLVPQYSDIKSRSEVDITSYVGGLKLHLPIVSSPMDTVTETAMVDAMNQAGGLGIIHRYSTIEQQVELVKNVPGGAFLPVGAAIGATGDYFERAQALVEAGACVICIDVAHGDHVVVRQAMEKLKPLFFDKKVHLMAGNVATGNGLLNLDDWGADSVRVGIGGGCFVPGTKVRTESGDKNIEDVQLFELVYTHTGELKPVVDKMVFDRDEEIISINGIECTKNHEFYVVEKKHVAEINEHNLHDYAKWVHAEDLDMERHLLIELE